MSALQLDFGRSYHYLRPPTDIMLERLWPTVQLSGLAYAIALLGIPLGLLAGLKRGKPADLSIRFVSVLGDATRRVPLQVLRGAERVAAFCGVRTGLGVVAQLS